MSAKCYSAEVEGIRARLVEVEVSVSKGGPRVIITGLPDAAVRESRDRVRSAIESSGYEFPSSSKVLVNLAPARTRKSGPRYDLPIALGILAASGMISPHRLATHVVLGELALDGRVRGIRGALSVARRIARSPHRSLLLPLANAAEAGLHPGVDALPVRSLAEAAAHLQGGDAIDPIRVDARDLLSGNGTLDHDLSDVRGQTAAKRALEVAAAGGHNLLLVGPPGAGKTMLARRLAGILPPLGLREALETTTVHSVAGELGDLNLVTVRPFRAPHHSVSMAGLLGGGSPPRPGEVSLAHHGILFLDELPEFDRRTLDGLRQPVEEGRVHISRVAYSVRYPARFALIAAMNPCRCGKHGSPDQECTCSPREVEVYRNRVSGPLLDRIDLRIEVPKVPWDDLTGKQSGDDSEAVRRRVAAARDRQSERLGPGRANAVMTRPELLRHVTVGAASKRHLKRSVEKMNLTARGHDRVLRVARTIADLAGREQIDEGSVLEALTYRGLSPS